MATSGTYTFNPDILEIIEEAYEQAGMELRGGYQLATARRSLDLLSLEWANRGIHLWKMKSGTVSLVDGTNSYALATDVIDMLEGYVTRSGETTDYQLVRMDVSTWSNLSTKSTESRPTRYYINRIEPPQIYLYPTPDAAYTLTYWYMGRIEDTGDYTNEMNVHHRFIPAMIAGLAYKLASKNRNNETARISIPELLMEYEKQFTMATEEDRDRSTLRLVPSMR